MLHSPSLSAVHGNAALSLLDFDPIADAVARLSDAELSALEDDLDFHAFTGIVSPGMVAVLCDTGIENIADAL